MINDVIVIDDIVSKNYQDLIEKETYLNLEMPWYYAPSITKRIQPGHRMVNDSDGWGHSFYHCEKGGSRSPLSNLLLPLMYEACAKINFSPKELLFGRVFRTTPIVRDALGPIENNLLHVDSTEPHLVVLYYVNDADGDTVITRTTYDQVSQDDINRIVPPPAIVDRVTPKKGRCVLFDGKFYHASTNPTKNHRVIVNFDVV